jgi:hypothetical protein
MCCTVGIGPAIHWPGKKPPFMESLREALLKLRAEAPPLKWRDADED